MALSITCRKLLFSKTKLFLPPIRTKFYVLVPEIPPDEPDNNALLRDDPIPDYSSLTKEKCANAIIKQGIAYSDGLRKLEKAFKEKTSHQRYPSADDVFKHLIEPMGKLGQPLEAAWGHVQALRAADKNLIPSEGFQSLQAKMNNLFLNRFRSPLIYNSCKNALEQAKPGSLTQEQVQVLKKYVLLSKLNGMGIGERDAGTFLATQIDLNKRRAFFEYKVAVGTKAFELIIPSSNAKIVQEFPPNALYAIATDKEDPRLGPWHVTLQPIIANTFLEYCSDSDKRYELWIGSMSRNAGFNEAKLYTSVDVEEIRHKRDAIAKALGYKTYVDMSMETKMAGSMDNVISILDQLLEKARPAQMYEIESLNKFASSSGFHKTIDIWDVAYWKRRQQIATFGFNQEKLRDYFPLETVLNGMFGLAKILFNIDIRLKSDVQTWHPDCRYYEIFEGGSSEPIASFFLDPYHRDEKAADIGVSGHTLAISNRSEIGGLRKPIASVIHAFSSPALGRPSLLAFDEVHHLFRNFGRTLHILLTKCKYSDVSGLTFMDWDTAEISSEFFGKWVYNERVLSSISGHFIYNEPLPKEIFDNLNRVRRHMVGYDMCRHLYFARLDLQLYSTSIFWKNIVEELWPRHFVFPLDKKDFHVCHNRDIISGVWAAKYFSLIWWKLLGADVFSAFQEAGLDNDEQLAVVGKRYRDTFLASGGGAPSSELFRRFRGRDLSPTAFLHLSGLQKPAKAPVNKS